MRIYRITKTLISILLLCFAFGKFSDANAQDVIRASGGTLISIDTFFRVNIQHYPGLLYAKPL